MRFIVARAIPFTPTRQRRRQRRPDVPFALGIRELMGADPMGSRALVRARIRRVVDHCAKLGRRRRDVRKIR